MRIIITFFIIYFSYLNLSISQDTAQTKVRNTIIKIDLVFPTLWVISPLFSNMFSVCVENTTFKNQSIQLRGTHNTITQEVITPISGTTYTLNSKSVIENIQIIPEYRFYIISQNLYLGPYLKYSYSHNIVTTLPNDTNVQVVQNGVFDVVWHTAGIGGLAGYQFFIKKRVSVDFLFGFGIRNIFYKKILTGEGSVKSSLADGLFSVTLGYRFFHNE